MQPQPNNIGLVKLRRLHDRANACGALENYKDAYHDLMQWPDKYKEILAWLVQAIEAHEKPLVDDNLDDLDPDDLWPEVDEIFEDV